LAKWTKAFDLSVPTGRILNKYIQNERCLEKLRQIENSNVFKFDWVLVIRHDIFYLKAFTNLFDLSRVFIPEFVPGRLEMLRGLFEMKFLCLFIVQKVGFRSKKNLGGHNLVQGCIMLDDEFALVS